MAELAERLKEAEEKNQRAISMAHQTKAGIVYIISNVGSFGEEVFKIGMTRRLDPMDRIWELGDASVPSTSTFTGRSTAQTLLRLNACCMKSSTICA